MYYLDVSFIKFNIIKKLLLFKKVSIIFIVSIKKHLSPKLHKICFDSKTVTAYNMQVNGLNYIGVCK